MPVRFRMVKFIAYSFFFRRNYMAYIEKEGTNMSDKTKRKIADVVDYTCSKHRFSLEL